jgi:hypothetical protein
MPRGSKRPTMAPTFDLHEYAKESDARIRNAPPKRPAEDPTLADKPVSETRLATRPQMGATLTDEAWARKMVGAPIIMMSSNQLRRLPLDHHAGFLISLMDGTLDLDTVMELSAMPRAAALRVVRDLFESGVVEFR